MDNKYISRLGKQVIYERIVKCGIVDKAFLAYLLFKGVCEGTTIEKVEPFSAMFFRTIFELWDTVVRSMQTDSEK